MQSLESIFVREFREAIQDIGYKDVYRVPLPESSSRWDVSGTDVYAIKGIEKEEFMLLNGKAVRRLPRGVVAKKRVIDKANRSFKRDAEGKFVLTDVSIPSGSMVVISSVKLELGFKWWSKCMDGYGYVDTVISKGKREYLYIVPKYVLYRINQTALVLSVKNMKNYAGMGYTTWRNGKIFLHIVPYKPNAQYTGSKILKTGYGINYSNEITEIVDYWQSIGYIPQIQLCSLSDGSNLCLTNTVVGYESYSPVEYMPISDSEVYGSEEG